MKKCILLLLIIAYSSNIISQETPKPDFPKRPYYLENGILKSLDKEQPKEKGVYNTKYILKTKNSSIVFKTGEKIEFIFEYSGEGDIDGLFSVLIGEISRKGRTFKAGGFKALGGKSKNNSENEISFEIKRIDGNIYKMILENVNNGEYAIVPQRNTNAILSGSKVFIYTFSVK
jgi:hypothetical protein